LFEGSILGFVVGNKDGLTLGSDDGVRLGSEVGSEDGFEEGRSDGVDEGSLVGFLDGEVVGNNEGAALGRHSGFIGSLQICKSQHPVSEHFSVSGWVNGNTHSHASLFSHIPAASPMQQDSS